MSRADYMDQILIWTFFLYWYKVLIPTLRFSLSPPVAFVLTVPRGTSFVVHLCLYLDGSNTDCSFTMANSSSF